MKNTALLAAIMIFSGLSFGQDISLWISHADLQTIEISISTDVDIEGFQFHILNDDDLDATLLEILQQPLTVGWLIAFNPNGLLLGYDPMGGSIPAGTSGVLLEFSWEVINADGYAWLDNPVIASGGQSITDVDMGIPVFVSGGGGPNDYLDVPMEFPTIQAAIEAAAIGDTVLVQPGIYAENIDFMGRQIVVTSTYLFSQDWSAVDNTVIDGQNLDTAVRITDAAELIGFTLAHGYAGPGENGAGIFVGGTGSRISSCIIRDCYSGSHGGGIAIPNFCEAVIENCIISGNSSDQSGGGIYIGHSSILAIQNCVISGNDSDYGGGIFAVNCSTFQMENVLLTYNSALIGGAIYLIESNPEHLENLILFNNEGSAGGGGISCSTGSSANLTNSILWNNLPDQVYLNPEGAELNSIQLNYCTIQDGEAGIAFSDNGTYSLISTLDSNPLFIDSAQGNFNLLPESPAIDAGSPEPEFADSCFPPSQGTSNNDQGIFGGPQACAWAITTVFGCTDPEAENYDPAANTENGSCQYLDVPQNLIANGGDEQITLTWSGIPEETSRTDVDVWISNVTPSSIEISMINQEWVGGFQVFLDIPEEFNPVFTGTSGGSASEAGFWSAINEGGMILSYSLTGAQIPPGMGVLINVYWEQTEDVAGLIGIEHAIFSDHTGGSLTFTLGDYYYYDPATIVNELSYNLYRDGLLYASGLTDTLYIDADLGQFETHCYTVTAFNGFEETAHSNLACATTNAQIVPQHFVVDINETGETSLVVIQEAIGLEPGDEIGLFDAAGLLNEGSCDFQMGELLVGAGVWTGEQLNITAIGAIDYCDWLMPLPGYIWGNPIVIKYWSAAGDYECTVNYPEYIVGNGTWGQPLTAVSIEVPEACNFNFGCPVEPFMNNMISLNFQPAEPAFADLFGEIAFIAWDDQGQYFVPSFGIDQIGAIDILKGYRIFPESEEQTVIFAEGFPADPGQPIMWQPFTNNLFAYLPQYPMLAADVFGPFEEDILVISNDAGEYFIPSLDVFTLSVLYPCEAYQVFLQGTEPVMFSYPLSGAFSAKPGGSEMNADQSIHRLTFYQPQRTGISQPIILSDLGAGIEAGDEIAAYADDILVGAAKVLNLDTPLVIPAWQGIEEYGLYHPGYEPGDMVELRLFDQSASIEQSLESQLSGTRFGEAPLLHGSVSLPTENTLPKSFELLPAYPNPFNAIVTLSFTLPITQHVEMAIYDLTGRHRTTLLSDWLDAGLHTLQWDAKDLASGVYLVQISTADQTQAEKILLLK